LRLWCICKKKYAAEAFSGEGSRRVAGRWHDKGSPVVYTSVSLALATLEVFVHVDPDDLPDDLVAIRADLADRVAVERIDPGALPANWRAAPGPEDLRDIGTNWFAAGKSVALRVPSSVLDEASEENVLLNPPHADFAALAIGAARPLAFDPRLRK